jgi:hypothetical protein
MLFPKGIISSTSKNNIDSWMSQVRNDVAWEGDTVAHSGVEKECRDGAVRTSNFACVSLAGLLSPWMPVLTSLAAVLPNIPRIDVLAAPPCWWAFRVDFASPRLSTNHRALTERGTGLGLGEYSTCVLCGIARSNRLTVRFARGLTVGIIRRQESLSSKHVHTIHCSAINRDTINLRDCICLDDNIIQVIYRRFK